MLYILTIEEFEQYFEKMIPVTESIEKELYLPEEKACGYLAGLVALSEKYRLPFAADIAILKAQISNYTPDLQEKERSNGKYDRKRKKQYILGCLAEAKAYADTYFSKTRQLLEESSILLRKVAAVADAKGVLDGAPVDQVVRKMKQDAELMPALTSAAGTVGYQNMICLLERAIADVTVQDREGLCE